jgi:hypothetical protein
LPGWNKNRGVLKVEMRRDKGRRKEWEKKWKEGGVGKEMEFEK